MGRYVYYITSTNFPPLKLQSAPDGWKDDESTFPRSPKYHGIFRKFSANEVVLNQDGAERLREIFAQTEFESKAKWIVYENEFNGYKGLKVRFEGNFDFTKYKDISDDEGSKVEVTIIDSDFWNTIKSRESEKPQLFPVPGNDGIRRTLDGFEYLGFTNEENRILLPKVIQKLRSLLNTENSNTIFDYNHAVPLNVVSNEDGGGAVSVASTSSTSASTGSFYDVKIDSESMTVQIGYFIEVVFNSPTSEIQILLKQFRSNSLFNTRIINTISGDFNETVITDDDVTELFADVQIGDYFILSIEVVSGSFETNENYDFFTDINLNFVDIEQGSISGMFIHEAFSRWLTLCSNTNYPLYTEIMGRTNSEPRKYKQDGRLSNLFITNGERVRAFTKDEAPLTLSLQQIFNGTDAIDQIGIGIEVIDGKDTIRAEERKYFFDNRVIFEVTDATNIAQSVLEKEIVNAVEVGYKKADYEEKDGRYEYNQKSDYTTPLSVLKNKLTAISDIRADDQGITNARKKSKIEFGSEDTRYDKDNFFIVSLRNLTELLNADFESWANDNFPNSWIVSGIVERKTLLNSDRCYFIGSVENSVSQVFSISGLSEKTIKINFENIGSENISPLVSVKLTNGTNTYYLQSTGEWSETLTEVDIAFSTILPPKNENEVQQLKLYSLDITETPITGDITFKIKSPPGLIIDDIYFGNTEYIAKTTEGYDSVNGAINGNKSLNLDITPARNLRRQATIRTSLDNNLSKFLTFNQSSKNSNLVTKKTSESASVAESANILIADLPEPFYKAIKWEFDLTLDLQKIRLLNSTFPDETKWRYLGIVKFWHYVKRKFIYVWLDEPNTGGESGIGKIVGREVNLDYITPIELYAQLQFKDSENNNLDCGSTYEMQGVEGGTSGSEDIDIINLGTGDLTIDSFTLSGADAARFTITGLDLPKVLASGERLTFNIETDTSGLTNETITASITVDSNSEANPSCSLNLSQEIRDSLAQIQLKDDGDSIITCGSTYILPSAIEGVQGLRTFKIENIGTVNLEISALILTGTNTDKFNISPSAPILIQPGGFQNIQITTDTAGQQGVTLTASLEIVSNSQTNPSCSLDLSQDVTANIVTSTLEILTTPSVFTADHACPAEVVTNPTGGGAIDVSNPLGVINLSNSFYEVILATTEINIDINAIITIEFLQNNTTVELLLKQFRGAANVIDQRNLTSTTGDIIDGGLLNINTQELFTDVQVGDYFILSVELSVGQFQTVSGGDYSVFIEVDAELI